MFFIAIVSNCVSSACGIRYNSLVVGHGRDGQNIALCILDPIQFAVCIEVILRLSGICDGVFIAGLCHGAVCWYQQPAFLAVLKHMSMMGTADFAKSPTATMK